MPSEAQACIKRKDWVGRHEHGRGYGTCHTQAREDRKLVSLSWRIAMQVAQQDGSRPSGQHEIIVDRLSAELADRYGVDAALNLCGCEQGVKRWPFKN
jgi:hypothetical protein